MGVPLTDDHGHVIGTIAGTHDSPRFDLEQWHPVVRLTALHVSQVLAAAALRDDFARALWSAARDSETGAPDRNRESPRVGQRPDRRTAPRLDLTAHKPGIIIDVDHLKRVNDADGHHAGDQVLCAVAAAIASTIRIPQRAARLGGDEFGVLFSDIRAADLDVIVADLQRELHTARHPG